MEKLELFTLDFTFFIIYKCGCYGNMVQQIKNFSCRLDLTYS